jgi:hypothetical protein
VDEGEPSAVEISFSADDGFASGGSAPTQGKAMRLSAQDQEDIGWESPSSWDANPAVMLDRERQSKNNADRPSMRCNPVLQEVAVQLDFYGDSEAVKVDSPLAVGAVIPALAAKVNRAPRSKADPVEAARKSARGQGLTEGSVLDRAIRRTAEKDSGTYSKSIHDFSILSKSSDSHLLEVAADCAVLFPADLGDPVQILSSLRAKELATAELALARDKIELSKSQAKEKADKEKENETRATSPTPPGLVEEVDGMAGAVTDTFLVSPIRKPRKSAKKISPASTRPRTRQARALGLVSS